MVGVFLFSAATTGYRQERVREGLRAYSVSDVMSTTWLSLPGETILDSPFVAQGLGGRSQVLAVTVNGRPEGTVSRYSLDSIPRARWSRTTLAAAMVPLNSGNQVSPQDSLVDALETMETHGVGGIAVTRDGELVGFIIRRDIHRLPNLNPPKRTLWRRR